MGPLPKTNSCSYNAQGFPWSSSCFSFFFFLWAGEKNPDPSRLLQLCWPSHLLHWKVPAFCCIWRQKQWKASKCFPDNAHIFRLSCWTKWKDGMSQPQTWGRKNDLNVGWGVAWPGRVCVGLCPPQALIYMLTAGMLLLRTTHTHTGSTFVDPFAPVTPVQTGRPLHWINTFLQKRKGCFYCLLCLFSIYVSSFMFKCFVFVLLE